MTYERDGILKTTLQDLPISLALADSVREEGLLLLGSRDVEQAQQSMLRLEHRSMDMVMRAGKMVPRSAVPKKFLVQREPPVAREFAEQPGLLQYVSKLAGKPLYCHKAYVWVTLVPPIPMAPYMSQKWHRDPYEGHATKSLKLFWYLSHVDRGAGPLEYLRGSQEPHIPEGSAALDRYVEAKHYPELAVHPGRYICTGPTDTVYIADTTGIHRGGDCKTTRRLSVTLVYLDTP